MELRSFKSDAATCDWEKENVKKAQCWENMKKGEAVASLARLSVHAHGARSGPNRTPAPPWIFLPGTVRADILSCPTPVLSAHFSVADCNTTEFSFKTLCCCAELPAKRLDSARESARYWLHPVLRTRGEQLVPAEDRKEETTLPHSFSP